MQCYKPIVLGLISIFWVGTLPVESGPSSFYKESQQLQPVELLDQGLFYQKLARLNDRIQEKAIRLRIRDYAKANKKPLPALYYYLGLALFGQNRFDEAIKAFKKAASATDQGIEINRALESLNKAMIAACFRLKSEKKKVRIVFDILPERKKTFMLNKLSPLSNPIEALAFKVSEGDSKAFNLEVLASMLWGVSEYREASGEGLYVYYYNPLNVHYLSSLFFRKAVEGFNQIMEMADTPRQRDSASLSLVKCLMALGDYENALKHLKALYKKYASHLPTAGELLRLQGICLKRLGRILEAEKVLDQIYQLAIKDSKESLRKMAVNLSFNSKRLGPILTLIEKTRPTGFVLPSSRGYGNDHFYYHRGYLRALGRIYLNTGNPCRGALYLERTFLPGYMLYRSDRRRNNPHFMVDLAEAWFDCGDWGAILENIFSDSALEYYYPESIQTAKATRTCQSLR